MSILGFLGYILRNIIYYGRIKIKIQLKNMYKEKITQDVLKISRSMFEF